jgi:hypothetical protein
LTPGGDVERPMHRTGRFVPSAAIIALMASALGACSVLPSLLGTGAASGSGGGHSGDASEPITTDWNVRGETMVGTSRVLGVNGPGTLTIYVSVDLVTP